MRSEALSGTGEPTRSASIGRGEVGGPLRNLRSSSPTRSTTAGLWREGDVEARTDSASRAPVLSCQLMRGVKIQQMDAECVEQLGAAFGGGCSNEFAASGCGLSAQPRLRFWSLLSSQVNPSSAGPDAAKVRQARNRSSSMSVSASCLANVKPPPPRLCGPKRLQRLLSPREERIKDAEVLSREPDSPSPAYAQSFLRPSEVRLCR